MRSRPEVGQQAGGPRNRREDPARKTLTTKRLRDNLGAQKYFSDCYGAEAEYFSRGGVRWVL